MTEQQTMDISGGGGTSFSWGPVGTQPGGFVRGTITALAKVQSTDFKTGELEFWDNGDPKMQYRVTLQTELRDPADPADQGIRNVYLDGSAKPRDNGTFSKLAAAVDAVRKVTGGTNLEVGGQLTLQWISGMGYSGDPRNFTAWYERPTMQLEPGVQPAPQQQQAPPGVQETINQQAAQGQLPPQWATQQAAPPPPAGPPPQVQQQPAQQPYTPPTPPQAPPQGPPPAGPPPVQQQPPQAPPPQQYAPPTGPPPAGPPTPAQQPLTQAMAQHSSEAIAALRAAGIDPATVPVQS